MAKLPNPDRDVIARATTHGAVVDRQQVLWRIHNPDGDHPLRWNQLRAQGPLLSARFDPWLGSLTNRSADGTATGVGYFGFDFPACVAEAFQETRAVAVGLDGRAVSAFEPTRPLHLLDLRGNWPIKIGASHLINSGPKDRCRRWAHAIRSTYPDYDGLLYTGMAGTDCVAVYAPPADFFPDRPGFTKQLNDPGLLPYLADAAQQVGYDLA